MTSRRGFLKGVTGALLSGGIRMSIPATALLTGASIPALAMADETDYAPDPSRYGSRLDALVRYIDPTLMIHNPHTNEDIHVRFFGPSGYDMGGVQQINHIWRDWRQESSPQIDPRLFWAMAAVRTSAMKDGHSGKVILLSGYRTLDTTRLLRSQGVKAALSSQHMNAAAMDITMEGIPADTIAGFVEWLGVGGTGYYPRNNFTHADSGPVRQWRG